MIKKSLQHLEIKKSNIICSYNIDLTRNAGNCLFKMLENKSSIFSNLTDKIQKLRLVFITKFLFSVIYFVSHESKFWFELWIILKQESGFCLENATVSNSGYVRKWKT